MSENKNKDNEKSTAIILYIGLDLSFFQTVQEHFRRLYPSITCEFESIGSEDEKVIQSYLLKIREIKPRLILMDFSQNERPTLHLARLWSRQNFFNTIPVVGLCDYKQGKKTVVRSILTKIPCTHIKSLEYESLIYNMVLLGFNKFAESHGFAMAKLDDPIHCYQACIVSLINDNFIKIESDYQMKPKQVLRLPNFWTRNKIVKSDLVMCKDQSQRNNYYNFKYNQVLQMAHVDPIDDAEALDPAELEDKQNKRLELVEESRHRLRKWITDNEYNSKPKFLKALIYDKKGILFDLKPLTDKFNFVIRSHPFSKNTKKEITNVFPQLIIFNLEYIDKETIEANADIAYSYNDSRMFQHVIKCAKAVFKENPPLIVVFNSGQYDSNYMQKVFSYENLLAVKDEMSFERVIKMFQMLESKISSNLPKPNKGDNYISKKSDQSYAEIEMDITLAACSENDIYFTCEEHLETGTVLRVSLPVPMYITVMPIPEYSKATGYYYGFIHGIGEGERRLLRRFINSVFFRGIDKEKVEQKEEFEKKKQEYIDAQKKQEEDREKLIEAKKLDAKLKEG